MSTINIGGKEIPAIAVAVAIPLLAALYVADAVYFGFVSSPTLMGRSADIETKEAEIAEKHAQAEDLKQRTKEIDQTKAEIEVLQKSITLLKSKIPGEAQVPILLYDIERMAKASDGMLNSFSPGDMKTFGSSGPAAAPPPPPPPPAAAPAAGGGAAPVAAAPVAPVGNAMSDILEMPVTIQASATYPQIIKFLDQLHTYERKLNVSGISITPRTNLPLPVPGPGKKSISFKNMLNVEFTLSAYVLRRNGAQP